MKKSRLFWVFNLFLGICLMALACQKVEQTEKNNLPELEVEVADGALPYKRLSTYGFFKGEINQLEPAEDVVLYEPASSLFTDYALKSRYIYFPENKKATLIDDDLSFPEGTVIIKNFYYPSDFRKPDAERRIIETRLMVHSELGWEAFPYIWNESQTDAILKIVGGQTEVEFIDYSGKEQLINYIIPNKNQCKTCHNIAEEMAPIGVKVKHLNNQLDYGTTKANQLAHWTALSKLEGYDETKEYPMMGDYENKSLPLNDRAMAYLDINCSHCHSEEGSASTSGLFLTFDQTDPMKLGINKTPVAAGIGAGKFKFDVSPGKADESILTHRMNSSQVGVAMPELGRTTVHNEGVALIREWINSMKP